MLACQDDGWLPGIPTLIASRLPPLWSCEMVSRIPTCRRSGNPGSSDPENLCNSTSNILEFQDSRFYHTLFTVNGRGIRRCGFGKPTPARFSDNEAWARRSLSCSVTKGPLRFFVDWLYCWVPKVWRCCLQFCLHSLCSFKFLFLSNATRPVRCFIDSSWCMVLAWACFTIPRFACAIWWVLQKSVFKIVSSTCQTQLVPSLLPLWKAPLRFRRMIKGEDRKKNKKTWMLHQAGGCIGTRAVVVVVVVVVVVPQAFGKPPFSPPPVSAFPTFRG